MSAKSNVAVIDIPIAIVSEANQRECWQAKSRRAKKHKDAAYIAVINDARSVFLAGKWDKKCKYTITLTRMWGKRKRAFDDDNLTRGFKAIRDGIALALAIDDGSPRLKWIYRQQKGERVSGYVRVEIEETA